MGCYCVFLKLSLIIMLWIIMLLSRWGRVPLLQWFSYGPHLDWEYWMCTATSLCQVSDKQGYCRCLTSMAQGHLSWSKKYCKLVNVSTQMYCPWYLWASLHRIHNLITKVLPTTLQSIDLLFQVRNLKRVWVHQ